MVIWGLYLSFNYDFSQLFQWSRLSNLIAYVYLLPSKLDVFLYVSESLCEYASMTTEQCSLDKLQL